MSSALASALGRRRIDPSSLQDYLRWAGPPNLLAGAVLFALWFRYPSPAMLLMGLLVSANAGWALAAYRLAERERVTAAVIWLAAGLWSIAAGLSLVGIDVFAVTMMVALLPVVAAVPYVSLRMLLAMLGVAAAITVLGSFFVMRGPPLAIDPVPLVAVYIFISVGMTVLYGVCGISLWQTRMTLTAANAEMEAANEALRESERTLEARVRERTAELEASERVLAEARDAALEANRQKSTFLARMSHELRTPLNAIIGFSEVLADGTFGELNEKQREYVGDIHQSGQHLLSLINDILDIAKIEAGTLELSLAPFGLPHAIENALTLMRERATRRGVRMSTELDPELGALVADERKVKQVLINLLTNAVKFTEPGGSVVLRARATPDAVEIAVQDTGVGIAEEDRALIFDDFRQAREGQSPEQEGTGLGLALSRRLVDLHGGRIWVESEVGRGSTFAFTIPNRSPEHAGEE